MQHFKIRNFLTFLYLWVIFALLDPEHCLNTVYLQIGSLIFCNVYDGGWEPVGSNICREGLLSQTGLSPVFWICNGPHAVPDPAIYLNVNLDPGLGIKLKVTF
jgi:hypothetical protein